MPCPAWPRLCEAACPCRPRNGIAITTIPVNPTTINARNRDIAALLHRANDLVVSFLTHAALYFLYSMILYNRLEGFAKLARNRQHCKKSHRIQLFYTIFQSADFLSQERG